MRLITRTARTLRRTHPRKHRCVHLALSAALVLAVAACTAADITDTPTVVQVDLTPPTATVEAGRTVVLVARPTDADGQLITTRQITWSSNNQQIATVSSAGVVSARAAGEVRIAASAAGQSAVATITVTEREVASVQMTPVAVSVRVNRTAPLQARALDADGNTLANRPISWRTSDATVATVSAQGVVTAVAPGAATITATSGGRSGQAAVTVTPEPVATVTITPSRDTLAVGTDRALTATVRDADGALLTGRPVAWSVNDPEIARVSSQGVVTALAPGNVSVIGVSEGRVGQATIVVLARLANAITLTPGTSTLEVGSTVTLTTQVTDPFGNVLPGRVVVYRSDHQAVATVSTQGVVSAIARGTTRITATSDGRSTSALVTVIDVPVATVQILPAVADVPLATSRALTVQARSASGVVLSNRTVTWTSGAPDIATVTTAGVVSGLAPGVAVIAASVDGITGFSTITVRAPVVATVTITPNAPELTVNQQLQLAATARTSGGVLVPDRSIVWQSSNQQVAFVTSSGVLIGVGVGTATITATTEGVSGTTSVIVR